MFLTQSNQWPEGGGVGSFWQDGSAKTWKLEHNDTFHVEFFCKIPSIHSSYNLVPCCLFSNTVAIHIWMSDWKFTMHFHTNMQTISTTVGITNEWVAIYAYLILLNLWEDVM